MPASLPTTPHHPSRMLGLPAEECDYLVLKAEKRLERSGVVDTGSGNSTVSDIRTSDGMFFDRGEDAIIEGEQKACITMQPCSRIDAD